MTIRVYFKDLQAGAKFQHGMKRFAALVGIAAAKVAQDAANQIMEQGRQDMARAGNFSSARWQEGLHSAPVIEESEIRIRTWHDVPYFDVFQNGAVIFGKPLLWIPLSFADVPKGLLARDYPGGLFRVDRKNGAPLLLSAQDRKPKYFGKESVTIPKKFHIVEICKQVAKTLRSSYKQTMATLKSSNEDPT